jgi:hypothetical protein
VKTAVFVGGKRDGERIGASGGLPSRLSFGSDEYKLEHRYVLVVEPTKAGAPRGRVDDALEERPKP